MVVSRLPRGLVLPPALSLLSVRFALRHDETNNAAQWIRYYGSQVCCFSKRNGTRPRAATSNRIDSISPREVGLFGITLLLARHDRRDLTGQGSHRRPVRGVIAMPLSSHRHRAAFCFREAKISSREEIKSRSSVVLKTVSPSPLRQTSLLPPGPLGRRFLFLPNSLGRGLP